MFFPGTSFPYVADYVGQARSFLEVGGFLLFLDQALFFGKVGKHLLFVSKKFIVRGIRTAVAP